MSDVANVSDVSNAINASSKISNYDNQIQKHLDRVEQLKRQKKVEEQRGLKAKRKADDSRNFIIGEIVCRHFPEFMKYQPKRNKTDRAAEFAPVDDFFKASSNSESIMEQIKLIASCLELERE